MRTMSTPEKTAAPRHGLAFLAILGGALIAIGTFLPWAHARAPVVGTVTRSAIEEENGWAFVLAGVLVVLLAIRGFRRGVGRITQLALVVLALAVLGIGGYVYVDISHQFSDVRETIDKSVASLGARGTGVSSKTVIVIKLGFGLYLVLVGGALTFVGARRSRVRRGPAPAGK